MKIEKLLLIPFVSIVFFLSGCGQVIGNSIDTTAGDISSGKLRKEVFALVSSAENSSTDYAEQYAYIEDIGDGRGYTAGIIGFTTGTGDLLEVVERYTELESENELKKYIPALELVNGTDSHDGLGDSFEKAWIDAAQSKEMIQAQNDILDEQYMNIALQYAREDGLRPLGQYITMRWWYMEAVTARTVLKRYGMLLWKKKKRLLMAVMKVHFSQHFWMPEFR